MQKRHTLLAAAGLALAFALATSSPARATQLRTILLTGFEPFDGDPVNPSWEAIKLLDGQVVEGYRVRCVRLPVDYRRVRRTLEKLLPGERPAAYIAFGEDAADHEVNLELDAVDHVNPYLSDSAGFEETAKHLRKDGAPVYHSTLPVDALEALLARAGVLVRRSTDAGSYVCDFTFYTARYLIDRNHLDTEMGFIHLPAVGQPWSVEQLQAVGRDIVRVVARSLSGAGEDGLALPAFDGAPESGTPVDVAAVTTTDPAAALPSGTADLTSSTPVAAQGFVQALAPR